MLGNDESNGAHTDVAINENKINDSEDNASELTPDVAVGKQDTSIFSSLNKALSGDRERADILLNFVFETYYNSDLGLNKYMALPLKSETLKIPLTNAVLNVIILFTLVSVADDFENKTYSVVDEEKVEINDTIKKVVLKHSKSLYNYIEQQFLNRALDGKQYTPLETIRKTIQDVRINNNITEELIVISLLENSVNAKRIKSITQRYNDIINEKNTKDVSFLKKNKKYANITNININGGCGLPEYTKVSDRLYDSIRYFLYDLVYRTTLSDIEIAKGLPLRSGGADPEAGVDNAIDGLNADADADADADDADNIDDEKTTGDRGSKSGFVMNDVVEFIENYVVSVIDGFKNLVKDNDAMPEKMFGMDKILENSEDNPIRIREPVFKLLAGDCEDIIQDVLKSKLKMTESVIHNNMKMLTKEQLNKGIALMAKPTENFIERTQQVKNLLELLSVENMDVNMMDAILLNKSENKNEEAYFYTLYSTPGDTGIQEKLDAKLTSNDFVMKAMSAFAFDENEVIKQNSNEMRMRATKIMVRNVEKYLQTQLNKALQKVITNERKKSHIFRGKGKKNRKTKKRQSKKRRKGKKQSKKSKSS